MHIPKLIRCENTSLEELHELCAQQTQRLYLHHQVYGDYCSVSTYIACPADLVFEYLAQTESLVEWTYSLRAMKKTAHQDVVMFGDRIGGITKCFCRTQSNAQAQTVDYYCAWDQADELWMIYFMRVVAAQPLLGKDGAVVFWTNCQHPYYATNPWPDLAPTEREIWVGDGWEFFYAGHSIELQNLKEICEYRYHNNISVTDLSHLKN